MKPCELSLPSCFPLGTRAAHVGFQRLHGEDLVSEPLHWPSSNLPVVILITTLTRVDVLKPKAFWE